MGKKVMLVLEETEGKNFNFSIDGDIEFLNAYWGKNTGEIDFDSLSPAEFWGLKLYEIALAVMEQAGAQARDVGGESN